MIERSFALFIQNEPFAVASNRSGTLGSHPESWLVESASHLKLLNLPIDSGMAPRGEANDQDT